MSVKAIPFLMLTLLTAAPALRAADEGSPQAIFDKRILPIFKSPNPSSCVQCHLAGVDLKNYILPGHEKTFVSLRDQGLIDLDKPEESRILKLIKMGDGDAKGAALIPQKAREAELAAFAEWIKASAADPKLRDLPKADAKALAKPARPVEVIRHDRTDQVLSSFERNIWPMRFRCMSCHTEGTQQNDKLRADNPRVTWFLKEGPEATMNRLIRDGKNIDTKNPEKSLLLLKPLGTVKHGGGIKFLPGDQGYKAFRAWLEDYAKVVNDKYAKAADLPKDAGVLQFGTDQWLKITNTPPAWGDKLLQVTLYAWDDGKKVWEAEPIATSDRKVFGKGKLWQHSLTLLAAKDGDRAKGWAGGKPALPPGKYLVKLHVDFRDRLAADWKAVLGAAEYAGQIEIDSRWPEGYGQMTPLDASKVKK